MSRTEAEFLHDLGTPLSGAILMLEVVLSNLPQDEPSRASVETALSSMQRVADLIRQRKLEIP